MISVQQRRDIWDDEHQRQFSAAERLIDAAIRSGVDGPIVVDVSSATTNQRVLERLREAYGEGGWLMTVSPIDGIDPGLFVKLKVRGAPRSGPGVG